MVCNLTKDEDLAILNEISQDFINSVIKNDAAGDVAGIDQLMKLILKSYLFSLHKLYLLSWFIL